MKYVYWLAAVLICARVFGQANALYEVSPDGKPHTFGAHNQQFWLDDKPAQIVAGEMHFGRVLADDWDLRFRQAKAMGLNTISFYLFWNQCEPKEGEFHFSGMTDVHRVLQLCRDNGLWAILRPGPYCCAEEEFGGIPYWVLKYPGVKIRTNDPRYVQWSRRYIQQVYEQVKDMQVSRGGPLLMVQIENEYGMVAQGNNDYLRTLDGIFHEVGFDAQLFTCDPGLGPVRAGDALPGVLRGRNGLRGERAYQQTRSVVGDDPIYVPELYTGWFTGWGMPIATRFASVAGTTAWTNDMINRHCSFCYYMFFGGTNYGFSNGCNEYLPVQTSYDYTAPIDEAGRTTEKYRSLRQTLISRLGIHPPAVPDDPQVAAMGAIDFQESEPLIQTLADEPTMVSAKPVSMEDLDQAYGCVLYRKTFADGIKGKLELRGARDYTVVLVNGKTVGRAFIGLGKQSNQLDIDAKGPVTLDLLVYNLGRISVIVNAASQPRARKGLIDGAYLDGQELNDWRIYSLPLEDVGNFKASDAPAVGPTFYHARFNAANPTSTFLDMSNWGMGVVWVNGHNLGRYWDRGALRSLFLPGEFIKAGDNEVTVLEFNDAPKKAQITGVTQIVTHTPVPFAMRLDQRNPG